MIKEFFKGVSHKARTNQRSVVFIICLLLAVLFWFITSMSRSYETVIDFPVSYQNLPFTRSLEDDLPSHIEFYYTGTGFDLFGIYMRKKPDSIYVDLAASIGKSGKINFPTSNLRNQIPGDLKPVKIIPENIAPGLSVRHGKRVPVELTSAVIEFRDRFGMSGKVILRPDSVDIAGPAEVVAKIHSIKTESLMISDIHENYFGGIYLSKKLPPNVQLSQPYIHYYIPVEEYTEGMIELPIDLPISQRGKVNIIPTKVKVIYMVELGRFNKIRPNDFKAETEVPFPRTPPTLEVKLKRKPSGLHHVRLDPPFVDYLITE